MIKVLATLTILTVSTVGFSFEKTLSSQKWEKHTLSEKVKLTSLGGLELKSVAHGLRSKKVAFLNFDVYVAELLLPTSTAWDRKPQTWENSSQSGVIMTFLRDVPAQNISEAFEAALKKNSVETNTPLYQDFLKKVTAIGDLKKGEVLLVARNLSSQEDVLVVEVEGRFQEKISNSQPWTQNILKIWSGKPADPGIEAMQKALFK
ncbi:MAG: hypothetical protein ACK5V3_11055 [Bdellovibrionales bacterium]